MPKVKTALGLALLRLHEALRHSNNPNEQERIQALINDLKREIERNG